MARSLLCVALFSACVSIWALLISLIVRCGWDARTKEVKQDAFVKQNILLTQASLQSSINYWWLCIKTLWMNFHKLITEHFLVHFSLFIYALLTHRVVWLFFYNISKSTLVNNDILQKAKCTTETCEMVWYG